MRFRDSNYAEFYDKQQAESGYPGKLLPPVIEALKGYSSVIDIGAGTGFFTIPLLKTGHPVFAVEPAGEMSALILKKCPISLRDNLFVINEEWENWHGEKHDASICIHSLYPMNDRIKAIELMYHYSERRIIIVRESSEMITLSGEIRKKIGINLNRDFNNEIESVLKSLNVDFKKTRVVEDRIHRIHDIRHESESIIYQLKLDTSFKEQVEAFISDLCSFDSAGLYFNAIYSDNVFIF